MSQFWDAVRFTFFMVLGLAAGIFILGLISHRFQDQDAKIQQLEARLADGSLYRQYYFFVEVPYIIQGPPATVKPKSRLDKHR